MTAHTSAFVELLVRVVGATVAVAAAVGAIVLLYRTGVALVRRLDALDQLLTRELTHNHGSAMKDDLHGIAVSIGRMQRVQDDTLADVAQLRDQLGDIDVRVTDHLRERNEEAS